ncbi:unnamed protein product [Echinostoma caproni]|uniref:Heat shock 70 kDa protein 14 n=1 Tax=Echinostoma caproni TaxID=27848 RepID=A0A183A689_9TREM|nr:unnamed protein product [Echinostoma caproni]
MATIGIDLGTTYSCVACYRHNQPQVILNTHGEPVTPSVVAFTEQEYLTGNPAVSLLEYCPENTVYDIKRLIGRPSSDLATEKICEQFLFEISLSEPRPKVNVQYRNELCHFSPEEITSFILKDLTNSAETFLQEEVTGAVVTVPASFNHLQRRAIKSACQLAGLKQVRLLNEPTAAALRYGLDKRLNNGSIVLVYDLGGGTFDLCVMEFRDSVFEVKCSQGNPNLGGRDFDRRLMNHIKDKFENLYKCNLTGNRIALERLRKACESAKFRLSEAAFANVSIPHFIENISLKETIDRVTFERLNEDLFQRTFSLMEQMLQECGISDRKMIDEVIMIGGSTRIPRIRKLMKEFFHEKHLNCALNPNQAVAEGAAIYAAKQYGPTDSNEHSDWVLQEVSPLSIGLEDSEGKMVSMIEPRTPLPAKGTIYATTAADNQDTMLIKVYQGPHSIAAQNQLLDHVLFEGIVPEPVGRALVRIGFKLNVEGIVTLDIYNLINGTGVICQTKTIDCAPDHNERTLYQQVQTQQAQTQHIPLGRSGQKDEVARIRLSLLLNATSNNHTINKNPLMKKTYTEIKHWLEQNPSAGHLEIENQIKKLQNLTKTPTSIGRR